MHVVSFYRFVDVPDPAQLRSSLQEMCEGEELLGTVLLANEGINGTLAGTGDALRRTVEALQVLLRLDEPLECRWTDAAAPPFRRLRLRVRKEIVALGRPDIRPQRQTGRHVAPEEWNALIDDPDVLLIDARNRYEIEIGTFPRALDPATDSFREFAGFADALSGEPRDRPVAMFCTGGIRCEKASALLLEQGYTEVYQLQGGILNYLERVGDTDNRWRGECFVFDTRVAVDRDLAEGAYVQCHACRRPLSTSDMASPAYREGVSCPRCIDELEEERAVRLEERRRQVALARKRGQAHIGPTGKRRA